MADPADKVSAATANGNNIFFIFSSTSQRALIRPVSKTVLT
jgi:hypothetical protein